MRHSRSVLCRGLGLLAIPCLMVCTQLRADPITYEISGVASGTIGSTPFTDASVELKGTGNTANVTSLFSGQLFANAFDTFTVTIGGVGTATITDPSEIWAVPTAGFDSIGVPIVVIGRIDKPPALDSITGLGVTGSNALAGYEGSTAIGPITDEGGIGFPACGGPSQDSCVHTTLGLLSFSENLHPETLAGQQTTFVATLQPVPEPSSSWELLTVLLALGAGCSVVKSRALKSGK